MSFILKFILLASCLFTYAVPSLAKWGTLNIPTTSYDGIVLVIWDPQISDQEIASYMDRVEKMGSRAVVIPWFLCQESKTSSEVRSCGKLSDPFPERLAVVAKAKGLEVTYLPIVMGDDGSWRGHFDPQDHARWFRTYSDWIFRIAKASADIGAPHLVIGTEFGPLYQRTTEWKGLLDEVGRRHPQLKRVLTSNWDRFEQKLWMAADIIGVSAYSPLSLATQPTDAELLRGAQEFKSKLMRFAKLYRKSIHLTEAGFSSMVTAAREPWRVPVVPDPSQVDWPLQARCFSAFLKAWSNTPELDHIGFWATGDHNSLSDMGFEFWGKPSEAILKNFFSNQNNQKEKSRLEIVGGEKGIL